MNNPENEGKSSPKTTEQGSGRRIKVVRVINRMNVGGPAIHVTLLTCGLNDEQMQSILVAGPVPATEGDMTYFATEHGVNVHVVEAMQRSRSLLSPLKDIKAFFDLYRLLRRESPQIVHTHTAIGGFLGRLAAFFARVPIRVHTFHGHVFHGYYSLFVTTLFLWLERILALTTQRIIAISESQAEDLSGKYRIATRKKLTVIPLGFELEPFQSLEQFRGQLRQELAIPDDYIIVGAVGRLTKIKNLQMFLQAAKRVTEDRSNVVFVIVGDGGERDQLAQTIVDLGIQNHVYLVGWKRNIATVYADIDLLTLTSLNEGTPAAIIEAMASGVPVIATSVGGVPDLIEDNRTGFLVPSEDIDLLSKSLLELIDDRELRKRLGMTARSEAMRRFSHQRLLGDIRGLYIQLLKQKGLLK